MARSSRISATEPRWLPPSAAVEFNRQVVEKFGGNHQLRSSGALKLALASPWNIWVYSKVVDPAVLAAALFSDLASVDAFECGNKRTAFLCAVAFIETNGRSFTMPDCEISAEKLRGFAERRFGESALAEWLRYWIGD
jgi:death-on-curing protein